MTHDLIVRTAALPAKATGILILYAGEGAAPEGAAAAVWAATGLDFKRMARAAGFKGKPGQTLEIIAPEGLQAERLLVLGTGKPESTKPASTKPASAKSDAAKPDPAKPAAPSAWADRGGALAARLVAAHASKAAVVIDGPGASPEALAEFAAGMRLRHYRFDKYKTPKKEDEDSEAKTLTVTLHVAAKRAVDTAIANRMATVEGTLLARDLVNEPANVLGTVEFAARAAGLAELGVGIEILDEKQMKKLGMNSLLCVSQGSARPAHLVIMRWQGGKKGAAPFAFVGKGVVFDTGGISIKPASNMEDMKGDMGGAAAVTGLMHTLASRKARVNVVGVIGLVENMPSGTAVRPGDIVKAMSGTTIEVINTDAEGRLVLADALWYTQDRFKPKFMVNLATLTGAIIVALGHEHAGLFSNDDALAANLLAAGLASGEKLWRMPMGPAYDKLIESRFADIKNSAGRGAGSITAAHFLARFVNNVPWAHLDIAGAAMGTTANEINTSWAPGFGVALLDRLVRDHYEG